MIKDENKINSNTFCLNRYRVVVVINVTHISKFFCDRITDIRINCFISWLSKDCNGLFKKEESLIIYLAAALGN